MCPTLCWRHALSKTGKVLAPQGPQSGREGDELPVTGEPRGDDPAMEEATNC